MVLEIGTIMVSTLRNTGDELGLFAKYHSHCSSRLKNYTHNFFTGEKSKNLQKKA